MQVFITNLGKYNEGEVNGAWFTPPFDFEDVKERFGLNGEYEEYAIFDTISLLVYIERQSNLKPVHVFS